MSERQHDTDDIVLDPSGIGEAVKHGLSPWYIKLRFQDDSILSSRAWKEANSPLSALPAHTGDEFEQDIYDELTPQAHTVIESWRDYEDQEENNQQICEAVQDATERSPDSAPTMLLQTQLAGDIEGFYIAGDADLILIWPTNPVQIRIFDIKSSWDERTYHQIQIAIYSILFDNILENDSTAVEYDLDGGVIYRETERSTLDPAALPSFPVEPRQDDVRRLLSDDGPFMQAFATPFKHLDLPVADGQTSPYAEVYNTQAVESNDISLLGLSSGEQHILRQEDLHTLEDVAKLIRPPEKPRPYNFEDPEPRREHRDLVRSLNEQRGLHTRISVLAQRAQALLGRLNPDHPDAHDKSWTPWIQGSGRANLPEDNPPFEADELEIDPGSLIRVYLNVQYDYVRDQVAVLSARLDCTNYPGSAFSFAHAIEDIPSNYEDRSPEETLITEFTEDLFRATQTLAELSGQPEEAPLHFYLYTEAEQDALVEATKRHEEHDRVRALRDLFGMREGIDQSMVSVIQPEIDERFALKIPSTGLFQLITELYPPDEESNAKLSGDEWEYTRESGETINLRDAFRYELFDDNRPYIRDGSTIELIDGGDDDPDGFYPVLPREGAQIPLEYLWASKEIDEFDPSWTTNPQHKSLIERYQWVDSNQKDTRISVEDIEALGETAAHAVHHLERAITYRNTDIEKQPLPVSELDSYTLGEGTLAQACREYLDLEHQSAVNEALSQYKQPVKQRILSGRAVPVRITDIEDHGYMLKADAELIYGAFTFNNPEQIAKASRAGGSDGGSTGSWKVATPLELTPTGYTDEVSKPEDILHSTPVTIDKFDPANRTATLKLFRRGSNKYSNRYSTWIHRWTTTEGRNNRRYFGPGEEFILDDASDDMNANKAIVALDYADQNPLYTMMTDFLDGKRTAATRSSDLFEDIDSYLKWVTGNCEFDPNVRQREFITQRYHNLSLLQGPPGTGKTSGALAHALLGRTYSAALNEEPLRTAVTGASNKSVDEVLDDVAELLDEHDDEGPLGGTMLVRLVLDEPDDPDHDNVTYVNYNSDEAEAFLRMMHGRLEDPSSGSQSDLDAFTGGNDGPPKSIIVFGTPGRLQKAVTKLTSGDVEDRYANGERFFDIIAADEASMLPLWQLFMVSAFWNPRGQVLLAGDQRQMPPVQSHEWSEETRRTFEEFVPYLSSLNYFRFLRGEPIQRIDEKDIESPNVDIPMTRLEQTYRCHEDVSEFLRRWVYSQDGIEYTSEETDTIDEPTGDLTPGVETTLEPEEPISMLLHDDDTSHQSNFVEAQLVQEIVNNVPDDEEVGIVVPHNAQKGLVSALCEQESNVDTVERFQGGQKDIIILSATVSDPGFLQDESEFILNPNRLNVAVSRMKKKLIVIAPKTLFRLLPQDIEEYSNSIIWKGLYSEVNASGPEQWSGTLEEFTDNGNSVPHAHIEVYDKRDGDDNDM